ncbi:MAG: hypothetical protein KBT29_08840 [Prevotellaceae bacterium]|nr:hypothetical protein [Candidatus Minthosoma caballi]
MNRSVDTHVYAWVFLSVFIGFPTTAVLGKSRPCIVFGRRTKSNTGMSIIH